MISRRSFIGGSDARIIMGDDEAALLRLWREKRGEVEPEDLSGNLIVQLGVVTEHLNRHWYERNTGQAAHATSSARSSIRSVRWMAATLDGMVEATGAVFEAKFMLPWSFSEEAAAEKHMAQLQHNMWVTNAKLSVLSIITGGGKWVEITIPADPPLPAPAADRGEEVLALRGERRAASPLRCRAAAAAHRGRPDRRYERVQFLGGIRRRCSAHTRAAFLEHERAKAELKGLMPEDAKEAIGHGVRAKRSKSGAISFDLLDVDGGHAALQ